MKVLNLTREALVTGKGSLEYLSSLSGTKAMIVTGGGSMERNGTLKKARDYLNRGGMEVVTYSGIKQDPAIDDIMAGYEVMRREQPDVVVGIGGGSALDAMKGMTLFYEFPHLDFESLIVDDIPRYRSKVTMVAIPSTSGSASEVTRGTIITDPVRKLKIPIMTMCMKPDVAILDPDIVMSMPASIAAETGLDALTHAVEAYLHPEAEEFCRTLARGAVEGIVENLPESVEKATERSRAAIHYCQSMAGIAFTNSGVGMVHGIAHALGSRCKMAHGLANAVLLPYVLEYNRVRDSETAESLDILAHICGCKNFIDKICELRKRLHIPDSIREIIEEAAFMNDLNNIVEASLLGATRSNPVPMDAASMAELLKTAYYGDTSFSSRTA